MAGTSTETLNTLYTTTWAKRRAGIVDSVFEENKLLLALKNKGMIKYEPTDGRRLEIPVQLNRPATSKSFSKGATFGISDFDPLTVAYDDWKNFGDQMVRYWVDDKANGGSQTAHLKQMNAKIDCMKDALMDDFETMIWANAGGSSTSDFNGLQHLVSKTVTSGSIHNIDQSTTVDAKGNYVWKNQVKTATGVFSVYGESDLTTLYNNCVRFGNVDLLVSDQTAYELGEAEAIERVRVVNQEAVSLGPDHITFKGKMWIWSPKAPSGEIRMLDRRYIGLSIDGDVNFSMGPWKELPTSYKDFVTQIVVRGNFWVSKRRCHGCGNSFTS